jgi:hypothetical protein
METRGGTGAVPSGLPSAVGKALSLSNPYSALGELLAGPAMQGIERPEPFGTAELVVRGQAGEPIHLSYPKQRDTLTPIWEGPPTWHGILLDGASRIRVKLLDKDLSNDDPIGVFELNTSDFEAALVAGHVHNVIVAEQTRNQVLFAGITVWEE